MKDYRTIISSGTVEMFCTTLYDCLVDSFEGCLLDMYYKDREEYEKELETT